MKEIGVLMKPAMSQAAILDIKTNTRRIMKPQPHKVDDIGVWYRMAGGGESLNCFPCPYGKPGDVIWIREVHYRYGHWQPNGISKKTGRPKFKFHAGSEITMFPEIPPVDVLPNTDHGPGWYKRNSLFMPRSCARTLLEVVSIRVERLQDISEEDALSEGIDVIGGPTSCSPYRNYRKGEEGEMDLHCSCATRSFMTLWESINGADSWYDNPWVWVVEFKKI